MATIFNKGNMLRRLKRWNKSWKVFRSNWMGVVGLIIAVTLITLAIFSNQIAKWDPHEPDFENLDVLPSPPVPGHILGTNRHGEDIFSILLNSLGISLAVGVVAGSLTVILGTTIGVASAYIGGKFDTIVMRITDIVLVIPALPVMLLLASLVPLIIDNFSWLDRIPWWFIIAFVYVVVFWPVSARLIRGQALSLKQRAFITSAKSAGAGNIYIIFKHLLPNVFPLMLTMIITSMRQAILYEAFLAFLGLSDPWDWSLGRMLSVAQQQASLATGAWWMYLPAAIAIALTTLSFAFIGIAFDEIVNPRLRR